MSTGNMQKKEDAAEILEAIGQENEQEGIKWTRYFMDQFDRKQWEKNQIQQEQLQKKRRFSKMEYYRAVAGMLQDELNDLEIPIGYVAIVKMSGKGVMIEMADRWGKTWRRAFKPDGTPSIDFNAVVGLLIDTQNTIDSLEKQAQQRVKDMGFILPT